VVLSACGTGGRVLEEPDSSPGQARATAPERGEGRPRARIGEAITLSGTDDRLRMKVTLLEVVDPAPAPDEFLAPARGNRFVAVRLRLENVGAVPYDDTPANGAVLIDRDDQQWEPSIIDAVEPGLGSPKIAPGHRRVGFITFEVPRKARPVVFQFTLDSGFGPETGEWRLRRRS
jgi:hypothetical protein